MNIDKIRFKAVDGSARVHQRITAGGQQLFGMDGNIPSDDGPGIYVVGVEKAGKDFNDNQKMAIGLMLPSLKQAFPDAVVEGWPVAEPVAAPVAPPPPPAPKEKPDAKQG